MLIDSVRRCLSLLPPSLRRRWSLLVPLLALAAAADTAAAVAIFAAAGAMRDTAVPGRIGWTLVALAARLHVLPLTVSLLAVALAVLAKCAVAVIGSVWNARVMADSIDAVFRRTVARVIEAPLLWHARVSSAELLTHATNAIDISYRVVLAAAVAIAGDAVATLALIAALMVLAPWPTLAASSALLVMVAIGGLAMRGPMSRWGREANRERQAVVGRLLSILDSVAEVKTFRREAYFRGEIEAAHGRYMHAFGRHIAVLPMPRIVLEAAFVTVAAAITATLAGRPNALPIIAVFAYAGFRIVPGLNRIAYHVDQIHHGRASVEQMTDGAVEKLELVPPRPPRARPRLSRAIELRNVSLRYPGADRDTLVGVTLTIRRGEALGVVGVTGAGKTTLLHLIAGLVPPTTGTIVADDAPIDEWAASRDGRVGFVPQRVALVDDSIRRNVAFGLPDDAIDEAAVRRAVRFAQLEPLIERLPAGLDTAVGERGARLSGGERQRIAIARAHYVDPELLLFDEPASAIDAGTEARLVDAVAELHGEKTLVVASHRMETLVHCDRILLIENGRVSEREPAPRRPPREGAPGRARA